MINRVKTFFNPHTYAIKQWLLKHEDKLKYQNILHAKREASIEIFLDSDELEQIEYIFDSLIKWNFHNIKEIKIVEIAIFTKWKIELFNKFDNFSINLHIFAPLPNNAFNHSLFMNNTSLNIFIRLSKSGSCPSLVNSTVAGCYITYLLSFLQKYIDRYKISTVRLFWRNEYSFISVPALKFTYRYPDIVINAFTFKNNIIYPNTDLPNLVFIDGKYYRVVDTIFFSHNSPPLLFGIPDYYCCYILAKIVIQFHALKSKFNIRP